MAQGDQLSPTEDLASKEKSLNNHQSLRGLLKKPVKRHLPSATANVAHRWSRRSSTISPLINMDFERSIRSRSHWINIMNEWGWKGKPVTSLAFTLCYLN